MAASHDLLEMLANPRLNLTVFVPDETQITGRLHLREICDPVSSSECAYNIGGVLVSDFVYPAWFESFRTPGSVQFDHGRHLSSSFEIAPQGYLNVFDVKSGSGWHAEFGGERPSKPKQKSTSKRRGRNQ